MSKIKGLKALEAHFDFQAQQTGYLILYKNLPAEKKLYYQLGLGMAELIARECRSIAWTLGLMRADCLHGLAGTTPEEYDPHYNGDGNPLLEEPRPYDAYREMVWHMHPDETPYGLALDLSPDLLSAVDSLIASKATLKKYSQGQGFELVIRDSDEGEWRAMTTEEIDRYARKEATQAMEDCLFTVGFNDDMARLRRLLTERGSLAEILDLIGPDAEVGETLEAAS